MGAIAEAIVAYAQPLIDETDGSTEQMNKALTISQACWNIALLPEEKRHASINSLGEALSMDDAELEDFQRSILLPMIRRHEEMFPKLHQRESIKPPHWEPSLSPLPSAKSPKEKSQEPGRYDPCPCNSGRKYKFCCGRAARAF
jgi:uncharacterized protein YecA (UPF0149 family)